MSFNTLISLALLATVFGASASEESATETVDTVDVATDEVLGTFLVD